MITIQVTFQILLIKTLIKVNKHQKLTPNLRSASTSFIYDYILLSSSIR